MRGHRITDGPVDVECAVAGWWYAVPVTSERVIPPAEIEVCIRLLAISPPRASVEVQGSGPLTPSDDSVEVPCVSVVADGTDTPVAHMPRLEGLLPATLSWRVRSTSDRTRLRTDIVMLGCEV